MTLFSKNKTIVIGVMLACLSLISTEMPAQSIPAPMNPPRLVNDFANIFTESQRQQLEQRLVAYNDSTSTQICVVTVNDLGGYAASNFATQLGHNWGVGQQDMRNGIVILIKPRIGNSRGQAFIATGYGIEPYITDAFAGRILDRQMIPRFANNDYFGGVNAGIDVIIERLSGEFSPNDESSLQGVPFIAILLIIIVILLVIRTIFKKGGDQFIDSGGSNIPPIFFPPMGGGRNGGFGGGGFGRGGGGGSGGFGGGGFGGGGAGRRW